MNTKAGVLFLIGKEGKMLSRKRLGVLVLALILAVQGAYANMPDPNDPNAIDPNEVIEPMPLGDALGAIADDLVANQIVTEGSPGARWVGMEDYSGAITQGLVAAQKIFGGDDGYAHAAREGCGWLFWDSAMQTPLGDSVLAWASFGASGYHNTAPWTYTAAWFFENVRIYTPDGAAGYAASFGGDDSSTVYYLSNLTLAAYIVNAPEKAIWRAGLVEALGEVTDATADFPVQSVGTAAWVLGATGSVGAALADVLVSHQVPQDGFDPGSFFWRFDHSMDDPNVVAEGYTQDAIFAVLGLYAVADDNPAIVPALEASIVDAVKAVIGSLGTDGIVYEHLSLGGQASYVYAAQMLLMADILGLDLEVDLNALDEVNTYEDLGIVLDSPIVWNPSFELPGTTMQTDFEDVVGWTSVEGDVNDSGVEQSFGATHGTWTAFLMGSDPGIYQVTQHEIAADDIIQLSVDAQDSWAATTLLMELYYVDGDGAMMPLFSRDVALTGDMVTSSVAFAAADDPNAVGHRLGILFDNVTEAGASWLSLDSVSIDFLAELPEPPVGPELPELPVVIVEDPNAAL
jgi:hypothetical protein